MQSLSPTARVILGMLRLGARTGYEIKNLTDISTRFFWGASYGQIYPELKRLEHEGLVEAKDDPRGKVRRRAYSLTPAGDDALRNWLTSSEPLAFDHRDEGLLKLFFGRLLTRDEVLDNVRRMREQNERVLERFHEIGAGPSPDPGSPEFALLALDYGIGMIGWIVEWCRKVEHQLSEGQARPSRQAETPARDRR